MLNVTRSVWQTLAPLWLFFVGMFAPAGCTCERHGQAAKHSFAACRSQGSKPIAPPLQSKTLVPGAIPASYSIADSGDAAVSLSLTVPPGRAGMQPNVALQYSSTGHDNSTSAGFDISAGSSITRCPKTMAVDNEIRGVQYDETDAYCLDGKRLVVVKEDASTIEFRTLPDTQTKIIGYLVKAGESHFEVFLPSGNVIQYGTTDETRPMAKGHVPRAWLASEQRDARGNGMQFDWCFAEDEADEFVSEYALDRIRYTTFGDEEPKQSVSFVYGQKGDAKFVYSHGMQLQRSLRLDEVQVYSHETLSRRYRLSYRQSETTQRTLPSSLEECGADGACTPPTRFHYAQPKRGFEDITTTITAPKSLTASPIVADMNGDGLDDWFVPDITAVSTETNPITSWQMATNTGNGLAAVKEVFLQEWSFQQNPEQLGNLNLLQPEVGTVLDYNQDGRMDVLLHDVYGNRNNHVVLQSKMDGTFEALDTGIQRPFPLTVSPVGLRNSTGAVHLADVTGDGVVDLIQCSDHGTTIDTALMSEWTLHVWTKDGFEPANEVIDTLTGIPCNSKIHTVDLNGDSITDLVGPGYWKQGGVPTEPTGNYSVHRRRLKEQWEVFDTGLGLPLNGGRTLFLDVNGDGLPDAVQSGSADGFLYTIMNTGLGFVINSGEKSLRPDLPISQDLFFHLAQSLDFDGDSRTDILMPIIDAVSFELPRWVILRATGGNNGFTFEAVDAGIPFETQILEDSVTLADQRGPRIGDFNGDSAPDVAIFLGNQLHIFQNAAGDADVLTGISDGRNEHEPYEPDFFPTVSFSYGHLTTAPEPDEASFYVARSDATNECIYPRRCVVGARRVVREYATNDGQGGQRRYVVRYRDGRYDRRGHGFLGFGERLVTDLDTGAVITTRYDNQTTVDIGARTVYPFAGRVMSQWSWAPSLRNEANSNRVELLFRDESLEVVPMNDEQTFFTMATRRHTRRMQGENESNESLESWARAVEVNENATMLRDSSVEILDFDLFGNVREVNVSAKGVEQTWHMRQELKNDTGRWILGVLQSREECGTAAGSTLCRTSSWATNAFGEVDSQTIAGSDGLPDTKLRVAYDKRDRYGNVEHVVATDGFGNKRETTRVFDKNGLFPSAEVNALGQTTKYEYNAALGVLEKETDPNGLLTEWKYDALGRLELETRPEGSQTTLTRTRERIDGVWRLRERTTTTGGADDETIFDSLGRPITTFAFAPLGARVRQRIDYDRLSGQVARKSVPTMDTTPDALLTWDEYEFDALGREIRHATPWNAVTKTRYDGLFVDVTDPLLHHTKTEMDPVGRTTTITDAAKGTTKYDYGPFGWLRSVTAPGNMTTTWTRDAFGRVRQLEEADRGTTSYVHNGFDEVVSSTDALGRVIKFGMDALGRVLTRTDTHAGKTLTTTWTWDTAPNGLGKLHTLMSPDAQKTYSYTNRGQVDSETLTTGGDSFVAGLSYDAFGRTRSIRYPQALGEEAFEVLRAHDAHGYVIATRDALTGDAYWELAAVDKAGRFKDEAFGNGVGTVRSYFDDKPALKSITTTRGATTVQTLAYDWDARLELKSRTDGLQPQNKTERFRHDELHRLTCAYFGAVEDALAPCTTSYTYMANGNVWSKSDVGTYSYTDPKHPHAVTNVPGETFIYDAVGNQVQRPGFVAISYTPFDLPRTISQGAKVVSFGYDGDEQRIRKTSGNSETIYFGDLYERVRDGAVVEHRYHVFSPERLVAIVTRGGSEPGVKYLHVDHLGSVESVTDENGAVVEKRSYDAFGARRNPLWGGPFGATTSKITKGFTGHEEDDEFGLVNMKGRMFDARLGRFTTTDPVIPDIFDGQSFNVYSYVWNNPLAFVDPSGWIPDDTPYIESSTMVGGETRDGATITVGATLVVLKRADSMEAAAAANAGSATAAKREAAGAGASAPTTDVSTTGPGGNGLPRETTPTEPATHGFVEGVVDGLSDVNWLAMVPLTPSWVRSQWETGIAIGEAYKKGDLIDAFNVVNPLIPFANVAMAIDDGDWEALGYTAVGVGMTVLGVAITKKAAAGKGPRTTRGPPKATDYSHIADPKNVHASSRPTPRQIRDMKAANRAQNRGELRSDISGEVMVDSAKSQRGITPPPNEVQVDHVLPVGRGGTRTQSNLQLITRSENRTKWNH